VQRVLTRLEGKVPTFANLHDLIRRTGLAVFLPE
jgi:hypothetical protein